MDEDEPTFPRHLPRSSLEDRAIIKIATSLCNNPQFLGLILSCNFEKDICNRMNVINDRQWKVLLAKTNELLSQLCVPVSVNKKILEFLCKASYRIMVWRSIYAPTIDDRFLQHFYWTYLGKIDTRRTSRRIIENGNIPVRKRFVLGCRVCLGEELRQIWNEMSDADKDLLFSENEKGIRPLLRFWANSLDDLYNSNKHIRRALYCAVKIGMFEAVNYILPLYRNYAVYRCMCILLKKFRMEKHLEEEHYDLVYFLFFQLTEGDQGDIFNMSLPFTSAVLLYFLEYELCRTVIEKTIQSSSDGNWFECLASIFYRYYLEFSDDDDCRELFVVVWRLLIPSEKTLQSESEFVCEFLALLVRDYFPFLLEKKPLKKLKKILDSKDKPFDFNPGKWKFLEFIIKEMISIPSLKMYRNTVFLFLRETESNGTAWGRFLTFISYIKEKN